MSCKRKRPADFERKWRNNLSRIEKWSFVLENDLFCDVTFLIGPHRQSVRCMKSVLMVSSPVFESMFAGPLASSATEGIELPDVDPQAFRVLLKYVYSGVFEASFNDALNVLYVANKYDIPDLVSKTSDLLKDDLAANNVVTIFQAADLLEEKVLKTKSMEFIISNFEAVVNDTDFINFTTKNLCLFLEKDELEVSEMKLFYAVVQWANNQCSLKGLPADTENCRFALKDAIYLIRFPLMDSQEFVMNVVPTQILSTEECNKLLQYFVLSTENRRACSFKMNYSEKERGSCTYFANFFETMSEKGHCYGSGDWLHTGFQADQSILVVNVGVYGPYAEGGTYDASIKLELQHGKTVIAENKERIIIKCRDIFYVKFKYPVKLRAGVAYRVSVQLQNGPRLTFYGTNAIKHFSVKCGPKQPVTFDVQDGYHQPAGIGFKLLSLNP